MLNHTDIKFFKLIVGQQNIGKETAVDINARCPVCGDSSKNTRKKRLHLYEKGGLTLVNCFNGDCNVHHNVWNFIKMTKPELLDQYKRETFGSQLNRLKNEDSFFNIKEEVKKVELTYHDLTSLFKPIDDSPAIDYLKNRGITYDESKYGKWYYGFQNLKIGETKYNLINSVIIPLYQDNNMYGFYSRSISEKMFCTYNPEQNIGYKIWNWFNIDKEMPVYIFEGIFDAIASGRPNVIASMGAKIPNDRISELKQPIFCYDNDKTGWVNGAAMANKGHTILIYPNSIIEKDMNDLVLNNPTLDIKKFIDDNLYKGKSAYVRLKAKL